MEAPPLDMVFGFEIDTSDAQAVEDFYGPWLGWTFEPEPAPSADGTALTRVTAPGARAPMGQIRQRPAAAEGISLRVESADVAADAVRLQQLGAKVVTPAAQDGDGTVRARITDPRGNLLTLVAPAGGLSPQAPRPGAMAQFELSTTDLEATRAFYSAAFGWTFQYDPGSVGTPYHGIQTRGPIPTGGAYDHSGDPQAPEFATISVLAADVPDTLARAIALGAKADDEPRSTAYGLVFARLIDPRGNRVGLFSLPQG
ncbi:VOC family protein [Streptomyces spectabilis]|uniref:VOC family protein n=1 Tax=Streptomyces spectabilis TaxID=68270 RepID=A0A516RHR4_STRST|nr:VOC family protein [Streptomyces spectabilis]QDQ15198.1 VOC family protein [Streptomyces spectabilis]